MAEYQLPQPQNLEAIFSMNPSAFNQAQQMLSMGNLQAQEGLKKAQLANMFDEQNDPLRVDHQRKLNQMLDARLPGEQAASESLRLKAEREGATQQDHIEAAKKKFMRDASDDDMRMLENYAQKLAYSQNPAEREKGVSLLRMHKDMIRAREAEQARLAGERERSRSAKEIEQMRIDAGKYTKATRTAQDALEKALTSGKWDQAATAYDAMAQRAAQSGDMESAQYYQAKAKEYSDKYVQSRNMPKAGGVNVGDVAGVPVNPMPTTASPQLPGNVQGPALNAQDIQRGAQFSSPEVERIVKENAAKATTQTNKHSLADVQKLYPGVPPEKLREAYKRKFGVDLQ